MYEDAIASNMSSSCRRYTSIFAFRPHSIRSSAMVSILIPPRFCSGEAPCFPMGVRDNFGIAAAFKKSFGGQAAEGLANYIPHGCSWGGVFANECPCGN